MKLNGCWDKGPGFRSQAVEFRVSGLRLQVWDSGVESQVARPAFGNSRVGCGSRDIGAGLRV